MATSKMLQLSPEELEAARKERHELASAKIKRLRLTYNELAEQKSAIEKQQERIKIIVAEECAKLDVKDFIDNDGTLLIGYNETNKKQLDMEKVEKKYGAGALDDCFTFKKGTSFFSKR